MENGFTTPAAVREDYWTEEATETLVEAWGEMFNRGNLRPHHWRQVSQAVNNRHGHVLLHTDVQCKNRINTLKKKYKVEKSSVPSSSWPLFPRLHHFIGPSPAPPPRRRTVAEEGSSESGSACCHRHDGGAAPPPGLGGGGSVVEAVEKLGKVYERMEGERQRQMVEVEKQRMKFAKDLEIQRMKLFMESEIQMEKLRKANRNNNKRTREQEEEDEDDDGQGFFSSFYCLFNV